QRGRYQLGHRLRADRDTLTARLLHQARHAVHQEALEAARVRAERLDEGASDRVGPEPLVGLALETVVEHRRAPGPPLRAERRTQRHGARFVEGPLINDHPVIPPGAGGAHDPGPDIGQDPRGLPLEGITITPAALRADPQHVPRLKIEDVDLANLSLPRRAGVEPCIAGRGGAAALTPPGPKVVPLHGAGRDARVRREDPDLELNAGAPAEPPRSHRIRSQGVPLDEDRHLTLDR